MDSSILLGFIYSFFAVFFIIPNIILLSKKLNWIDASNKQKVDQKSISPLGGIAIFSSFWMTTFSYAYSVGYTETIVYVFLASTTLFLISLWDDIYTTAPLLRLLTQLVVATVCYIGGIQIEGLYGFLGYGEVAPLFQYILTVLTIVTLINAYNLIDGINGLAASLSLFSCLLFSILFWQAGETTWLMFSVIGAGTLLGFLPFNLGNARIFMGDNGSTFLGLLLSIFLIKYLNMQPNSGEISGSLIIALSIVSLPILDLIRVSIHRILQGKSPFSGDLNHIHHLLLLRGKSHNTATIHIVGMQALLIVIAQISFYFYSPTVIMAILISTYLIYTSLLRLSIRLTEIKETERERIAIGGLQKLFS
ncbi:MAG: UDP-GlcNAc:undecaprenyl-phosphate GlcNAc-1-phosphate transferase [Maribacter sp.]|jgi:UDP-GlcNAc:undecaprenyl-phosphate GlcNAc-1-phosphate transferase